MSATQFPGSVILAGFRLWLVQHRGICTRTVGVHLRYAEDLMTLFGVPIDDLDAACVRHALLLRIEGLSQSTARGIPTSLRLLLRYLACAGLCSASLEGEYRKVRGSC